MVPLAQEYITEARTDLPQGGNLLYDRGDIKYKKRKTIHGLGRELVSKVLTSNENLSSQTPHK